jgi:hypothetical protein
VPKNSKVITPKGSLRLVADWDKTFGHGSATAVLDCWRGQSFATSTKSLMENTADHEALLRSFVFKVEPFDCFLIANWRPNENQLSDVILALFDRNWGHPFALPILQGILGTLLSKRLSAETRDLVMHIRSSLDRDRPQILVRRERWGSSSRADIDICSRGANGFLLCIEHKVRGGKETFIDDKFQTERLWEDAVGVDGRAAHLEIDSKRVIAIFLTPDLEPARCNQFVSLSFGEFADAATTAVTAYLAVTDRPSDAATSAATSILGFMNFYRRI